MIPEKTLHQIKRRLRRGFPQGELVEELRRNGYAENDIEQAFPAHHYDLRSWLLTFASLLLVHSLYSLLNGRISLALLFAAALFYCWNEEKKRLQITDKKTGARERAPGHNDCLPK